MVRCRDCIFEILLNYLKPKFNTWPQGDQQFVIDGFERKAKFPKMIGAINGTHKYPINKKGYNSLCREDMRFIHVVAGNVGSCHGARALLKSNLWEN